MAPDLPPTPKPLVCAKVPAVIHRKQNRSHNTGQAPPASATSVLSKERSFRWITSTSTLR